MNSVTISGRLTSDVEVRKTQSGLSVASFTVAVQKDKEHADFINCVAWRQSADFLGQYSHKGDMVGAMGRLQTRDYERDGQKVYVTEVIADRVEILAKKAQNQPQASGNAYGQGNTYAKQNPSQNAQNQPYTQNGYGQQYAPYPNQAQPSWETQRASEAGLDITSDDLPF